MSLSSRSPLFDNRQVCPAIAHEGPWEALNILGRVNQRPTDSDAPQNESVQKVVTLIQENDELKADVTNERIGLAQETLKQMVHP